jgi:twitching motility protein PilT
VEFIHLNKKCLFSHRGVGDDTASFSRALKSALRQDPDIIFIGEMRDRETIEAGLSAAETGHLVFGTLHTSSAPGTISRILDVFGGDEQPAVRAMIAGSLIAVISQMLLPKLGGGRVCVPEILVSNNAISNLIREDKVHQIYSQMQLGQGGTGMQTQTQVLMREYEAGKVSKDAILQFANKKEEVKKKLGMPV